MNTPNPDEIQSDLPKRPSQEIQAGHPLPARDDAPPRFPDYDFIRKRSALEELGAWFRASWQVYGGWVLILVLVAFLVVSVSSLGRVPNKTFSNINYHYVAPGPHPAWYPPGQDPWDKLTPEEQKRALEGK